MTQEEIDNILNLTGHDEVMIFSTGTGKIQVSYVKGRDMLKCIVSSRGFVIETNIDKEFFNENRETAIELVMELHAESREEAIISAFQEYIELLEDELNEVVPIADDHGWRTKRYEAGVLLREKINQFTS